MYSWLKEYSVSEYYEKPKWIIKTMMWLHSRYKHQAKLWADNIVSDYEVSAERTVKDFPELVGLKCWESVYHEAENFTVALITCSELEAGADGRCERREFVGFIVEDDTIIVEMLLSVE